MSSRSAGHQGVPIFPLILISVGVILLLQTLGVIPWWIWGSLWRFWPVALVLIGLGFILRNAHPAIMSTLVVLTVAGVVAFTWATSDTAWGDVVTSTYSEPVAEAERAHINIRFGAGELTVGSLPAGSEDLISATFTDREDGVDTSLTRNEGIATVNLESAGNGGFFFFGRPSSGRNWDVQLSRDVPVRIDIDGGAGSFVVNLEQLTVTAFDVDTGASSVEVTAPVPIGHVQGRISGGVSSIDVRIPDGVAARISAGGGISSVDVDESRFPRTGGYYQSPDYDSASDRLDLAAEAGVSSINIR